MSIRKELNSIANKVNKIKEDKKRKVEQIVEEVLSEARLAADAGKYELYVSQWCGDYVPLAGDQVDVAREKTGLLETVFKNGKITKEYTLEEIRKRSEG